jgi:hypothetical protein
MSEVHVREPVFGDRLRDVPGTFVISRDRPIPITLGSFVHPFPFPFVCLCLCLCLYVCVPVFILFLAGGLSCGADPGPSSPFHTLRSHPNQTLYKRMRIVSRQRFHEMRRRSVAYSTLKRVVGNERIRSIYMMCCSTDILLYDHSPQTRPSKLQTKNTDKNKNTQNDNLKFEIWV